MSETFTSYILRELSIKIIPPNQIARKQALVMHDFLWIVTSLINERLGTKKLCK